MRAKRLFKSMTGAPPAPAPRAPRAPAVAGRGRRPLDSGDTGGYNRYKEFFIDNNFPNAEEAPVPSPNYIQGTPEASLRRLSTYAHLLRRLAQQGQEQVSCTQIGAVLQLGPSQVRKDLGVTGVVGRPKVGYKVLELCEKVESFLGWTNTQDAVLVGVGSLGTALLGYKPFSSNGVRIVLAFDNDPAKVDEMVHHTPVFPLAKLPNLVGRLKIHVGILTVPAEAAQTACDLLVRGGVRAIWNFTPTGLQVPEDVIVQNENLFSSLAVLSGKLAAALRASGPGGAETEV